MRARKRQGMWASIALACVAVLLLLGADATNDVGPLHMETFIVPPGVDSAFTWRNLPYTTSDTDTNSTWAQVTRIGIKYDVATVGVDSLGLHEVGSTHYWNWMPYPRGSVDEWEQRLMPIERIRRAAATAKQDTILQFQNGSAGNVWIYLWGS